MITQTDLKALVQAYRESIKPRQVVRSSQSSISSSPQKQAARPPQDKNLKKLEELGITVFDPKEKAHNLDWDFLAGYEKQKRDIEDTVLLALNFPEIYDQITTGTRMQKEPNAPKAVLFEGPPGTGKTTSAKIIAQQVKIPLIYLPLEAIMSKFYGESEKQLGEIW